MNVTDVIEIKPAQAQPRYCHCEHDSLQYHFFVEGRCYAVRLFVTPTLHHASLWYYDGSVHEPFSSTSHIQQSQATHPDIQVEGLTLSATEHRGTIRLPGDALTIEFEVRAAYAWAEPIGTVVHQPNLSCSVSHHGKKFFGVGYCKRYCWNGFPNHWGYRFFHGTDDRHSHFVWTADATFGTRKYAYFKVLDGDGTLLAAKIPDSCHRDNAAYASIEGHRYTLRTEVLGTWETRLRSTAMDSLMTQHYCAMTLSDGNNTIEGVALNELCFGTLG